MFVMREEEGWNDKAGVCTTQADDLLELYLGGEGAVGHYVVEHEVADYVVGWDEWDVGDAGDAAEFDGEVGI